MENGELGCAGKGNHSFGAAHSGVKVLRVSDYITAQPNSTFHILHSILFWHTFCCK